MTKDQFKTGESPFIRVETCGGDLVVKGWAEASLQIKGDYEMADTEKGYQLSSMGDLYLYVPKDAVLSVGRISGALTVRQFIGSGSFEYVQGDAVFTRAGDTTLGIVHGDLVARSLIGQLAVDEVNGDMVARGAGQVTIGALHGDLSGRLIDGNLTIQTIHGDADLRTINGDVLVNQGYRDINLNGISGLVSIAGVNGDIRLRGGLADGDHSLEARGDIVIRWPKGMALNLNAMATRIDNRLSLDEVTEKQGSLMGRLGEGGVNVSAQTSGRIILREEEPGDEKWKNGGEMDFNFDVDMAGMAARIEAEVNSHIARVTRDLETKFGADFGQRINDKIARKMDKAAERSRRRPDFRGRIAGVDFAQPPAPAKKPVSTEEQLKILKMVETGKISPEEAGMLLEAMEA